MKYYRFNKIRYRVKPNGLVEVWCAMLNAWIRSWVITTEKVLLERKAEQESVNNMDYVGILK